ncbi:MAG: hypothetical protein R3C03_04405 [Pirellulaceae bacterium]
MKCEGIGNSAKAPVGIEGKVTSTTQDTTDPAFKKLQEVALRILNANTAYDLWEKVFTPEQQTRLGGELEAAYRNGGPVRMWATVYGCTDERAVIDIAFKFNHLSPSDREWLLKETGEHLNAEEAFEHAITNNELVLNSLTREVFWNGDRIEFDWFKYNANWAYIWEVAKHAKVGLTVDSWTFGENRDRNYVSRMKSQMTERGFPIELADLIESAGTGTQRLGINPEQIRLFEHLLGTEIREWTP